MKIEYVRNPMHIYLFKLNGWPNSFDERVEVLSNHADLTIIRSSTESPRLDQWPNNIRIYDLPPKRGASVSPSWLKPVVFSTHVILGIILSMLLIIKDHQRPDVIHAFDYALGGTAGAIVAFLCRCPLVISVRGYKESVYKTKVERGGFVSQVNYRILRLLTNFALSRADHIITKAEYQRELIKDRVPRGVGITTIPTGVDFDIFTPETQFADVLIDIFSDEKEILSNADLLILHLGKLTPEKGVDSLIRHATEGQGFQYSPVFLLVGDGHSTDFLESIKTQADEAKTEILVHDSRIPFEHVPALIDAVDIVVLLSEESHEGVPRVLQEACAMGTPVIASDVRGINNAFTDIHGCFLIDRDSTEEFVDAVNEISKQDFTMDRDVLSSRFDIKSNYARYADIYRDISN